MASRREHQKQAVADTLSGFKNHDRGQLVMACGTGKTLVALWVKEDLDAERTLVLVPSIALVDQFASEWRKHHAADREFTALCVCSDTTVGQPDDEDSVRFTAEDLSRDGFDVTTDPERIASFLKRSGRKVIFSTYQSLPRIAEAQMDVAVPAFDLAIADEAHWCAGDQDGLYATILDGDRIRADKRLFATATPKIQSTTHKDIENVADMSDEAVFGKVFHRLTLGSAIRQGILSDYRVFITQVDDPGLHRELTANAESAKERRRRSVQVSMLKTIREYGLQRVVTFHSRVKDAKLYAAELPQVAVAVANGGRPAVTPGTVDYVSGEMSAEVRKQKLDVFRGGNGDESCHVLSNARCLSEGVDVAELDGIAFIDPRKSEVDVVQALGRVIRKHKGKEFGTVILPVFLGEDQNVYEAIENSSFRHIVDVLSAIRAHDIDFGIALDSMRQRQVNGETFDEDGDPFSKIKFDLKGVTDIARVLKPVLLESLTDVWEVGYACVKAFYEKYGRHPKTSENWRMANGEIFAVGDWLAKQRMAKRRGRLSTERIKKLDLLEVVWDINLTRWMEFYALAREYFEKYGHLKVHYECVWPEEDPNGEKLGKWIVTQRQKFFGNSSSSLSDEQKELLNQIGMIWSAKADSWEDGFSCAAAFYEKYGHLEVKQKQRWPEDDPNGFPLGSWIHTQRRAYWGRKNLTQMSVDKAEKLNAIGMIWRKDAGRDNVSRLTKRMQYFRDFWKEHGHLRVPKGYKSPDGYDLYIAAATTRTMFRRKIDILPEHIAELDRMGFEWEPNKAVLDNRMQHFRDYWNEYGHLRVPRGYRSSDGFDLYSAAVRVRHMSLSPEHVAELDRMSFEWRPSYRKQQQESTSPIPDLASRLENEEVDVSKVDDSKRGLALEDLVDRLKDEESADDLPEQMAHFGCDLEESRELIQAGSYDDALALLEEATGSSFRMKI